MANHTEIDDEPFEEETGETGAGAEREAETPDLAAPVNLERQERIREYRGKLDWTGDLECMRSDR